MKTIPEHIIRELIFLNVKWYYESYDYRAARAEYIKEEMQHGRHVLVYRLDHTIGHEIPDHIKKNYIIWRTGKVRSIDVNPNGIMWKFRIGNKFAKTFYLDDFGIKVKPKLYIGDDRYNLIPKGLAVVETL
jgi:hypothetical protein